jgi:formyl-CoA transferase
LTELGQGALTGITVLDLTRVLAGPYCTMLLGDFGAEVIKVEQPGRGDDSRAWAPPSVGGESAYYLCANRNKRSISLNLNTARGRELLLELASSADVVIENFKFGAMEAWGLGYAVLRARNPRLVYCSIAAYGEGSPYADRPGYDFIIQAMSGLMSTTGSADGEPTKVGVAVVDVMTGLHACVAILAALAERARSGSGQRIEVSLLDSALASLVNVASSYLVSGKDPLRFGNAHPTVVPYQPFKTRDGWIALAVGNDAQFRTLCRVIGLSWLADDSRYATNAARVEHRDALVDVLNAQFCTSDSSAWLETLVDAGIPCGPINTVPEIFDDPHVSARAMVTEVAHPTAGRIRLVAPPYRLERTPPTVRRHPPLLGEHTSEVLCERLGLDADAVAALQSEGIV